MQLLPSHSAAYVEAVLPDRQGHGNCSTIFCSLCSSDTAQQDYLEFDQGLHCWRIRLSEVMELWLGDPLLFANFVSHLHGVIPISGLCLDLHEVWPLSPEKGSMECNKEVNQSNGEAKSTSNLAAHSIHHQRGAWNTCVTMFPSSSAMTEAGMARPSLNICVIPALVPIIPMEGKPDRATVSGCLAGALAVATWVRVLQTWLCPVRNCLPCSMLVPAILLGPDYDACLRPWT